MGRIQAALGGDGGRAAANRMTTLMAYADAISVRPGDTINFKVSCDGADQYNARIVRLLSPEAGPDAPPFRTEPVDTPANGTYRRATQPLASRIVGDRAGAPADRRAAQLLDCGADLADAARRGRQAIAGTWSESTGAGFGLMLNEAGEAELRLGSTVLRSGQKLLPRKWYFVAASYDASDRRDRAAPGPARRPDHDGGVQRDASGAGERRCIPRRPAAVRRLARRRQRWTGRRSAAGRRLLQRQDRAAAPGQPRAGCAVRCWRSSAARVPARADRSRRRQAGISPATSRPRSSATSRPIGWTASPSTCRRAP